MSKTTTTEQKNSPPAWAAPLFKLGANQAMQLYRSGSGGGVYNRPGVARLSQATKQGIDRLRAAGGMEAGGIDEAMGMFRGLSRDVNGPSAAEQYLTGTASGKYLAEGNPYYRQRLDNEIADQTALINSASGGRGRYGGYQAGRAAADSANQTRLAGLENDWNRERGLQMQSVGMIDAADQNNVANRLAAAGGLADLGQREWQNRLTGAQAQLQAGSLIDRQRQARLDDRMRRWYARDNQDWNRLSLLFGGAQNSAQNYGTQTQTQQQPINPFGIIGGLLGPFMGGF